MYNSRNRTYRRTAAALPVRGLMNAAAASGLVLAVLQNRIFAGTRDAQRFHGF